jgi:hypothetical protein
LDPPLWRCPPAGYFFNLIQQFFCSITTGEKMTDDSFTESLTEYKDRLDQFIQQSNSLDTVEHGPSPAKTPLIDRVKKLLNTIPVAEQQQGLSLSELQIRLRGRKGKKCHPGELADCLRKLGYERRRGWRQGRTGFRAVWKKITTE